MQIIWIEPRPDW